MKRCYMIKKYLPDPMIYHCKLEKKTGTPFRAVDISERLPVENVNGLKKN